MTLQRVRSLITEPEPDTEVERGEVPIRGVAWSGAAPIARVEASISGGPWQDARLVGERKRHSWQGWELLARLEQPGATEICARATDMAGRTQPDLARVESSRLWEQCNSQNPRRRSLDDARTFGGFCLGSLVRHVLRGTGALRFPGTSAPQNP